jgi:hypothetical protein
MTITRTFYYNGFTDNEEILILRLVAGSNASYKKSLYEDEQLTKKVGSLKQKVELLDNTKKLAVLDLETTITTDEGIIKYNYIRDSYKKITTVDTERTGGIFTKGIVEVTQVNVDKGIRKVIYTSHG